MSEFLPVPGYEDRYEVNKEGIVRSVSRTIQTLGGVKTTKSKPLRPFERMSGHKMVCFTRNLVKKNFYVSCLVLMAFVDASYNDHSRVIYKEGTEPNLDKLDYRG